MLKCLDETARGFMKVNTIVAIRLSELMGILERRGASTTGSEKWRADHNVAFLKEYGPKHTEQFQDDVLYLLTKQLHQITQGDSVLISQRQTGEEALIPETVINIRGQRNLRNEFVRGLGKEQLNAQTEETAPTFSSAQATSWDTPPAAIAPDNWDALVIAALEKTEIGRRALAYKEANNVQIDWRPSFDEWLSALIERGSSNRKEKKVTVTYPGDYARRYGLEAAVISTAKTLVHELAHQEFDNAHLPENPRLAAQGLIGTKLSEAYARVKDGLFLLQTLVGIDWKSEPFGKALPDLVTTVSIYCDGAFASALRDYQSAGGNVATSASSAGAMTEICIRATLRYVTTGNQILGKNLGYDLASMEADVLEAVRAGTWADVVARHPLLQDSIFAEMLRGLGVDDETAARNATTLGKRARSHYAEIDVAAFGAFFTPKEVGREFHSDQRHSRLYREFQRLIDEYELPVTGTAISPMTGEEAKPRGDGRHILWSIVHQVLDNATTKYDVSVRLYGALEGADIPEAAKHFIWGVFLEKMEKKWEEKGTLELERQRQAITDEWRGAAEQLATLKEGLQGFSREVYKAAKAETQLEEFQAGDSLLKMLELMHKTYAALDALPPHDRARLENFIVLAKQNPQEAEQRMYADKGLFSEHDREILWPFVGLAAATQEIKAQAQRYLDFKGGTVAHANYGPAQIGFLQHLIAGGEISRVAVAAAVTGGGFRESLSKVAHTVAIATQKFKPYFEVVDRSEKLSRDIPPLRPTLGSLETQVEIECAKETIGAARQVMKEICEVLPELRAKVLALRTAKTSCTPA